jgi:hypothetical protein
VLLPLAPLPLPVAGALFVGISSSLLAWLLTRTGYHQLPLFLSTPFLMAVSLGQWSPLLTAAALSPALGFLTATKPNLGLAALAYRPSWRALLGAAVFGIVSLIVLPRWPIDWLHNVASRPEKFIPLVRTGGFVLLLAAIRWRTAEARLFLVLACVPQNLLFYDQLPLWLIPRTLRQSLVMSIGSGLLFLLWHQRLQPGEYYMVKAIPYAMGVFFVALAVLLWATREQTPAAPEPRQP